MQLTTDDKMAGLETPDGRTFKPHDGVITLPDELSNYGKRAARTVPMFHVRTPQFSGADMAELRARYEAWAAQQEGKQA